VNEIMGRQFLRLNLQNPIAIKTQTDLRPNDLDEFKYILEEMSKNSSRDKNKRRFSLSHQSG